ncbi:(4Fe-4S)-binding protein [bacterium]|nr:(4Fe-4S)-binding protein [bacterium]
MKEIVIISGKGGTGKTTFAAAFAVLAADEVVVADCDVDAADMHLLLGPDFGHAEAFVSGETAVIDPESCNGCDRCGEVCQFDAVRLVDGAHVIDPIACEGCGYCARVCPEAAITSEPRQVGHWYRSRLSTGGTMVHARLGIGADNSGKLVTRVKNEARRVAGELGRELVLVDGSPGVGCPVVASLAGASLVVLVTEPTVSGRHDLERVHELVRRFDIPCACILNKSDLNPDVRRQLLDHLAAHDVTLLAEFPYDEAFTAAITAGRSIVDEDPDRRRDLAAVWTRITRLLEPEEART